jgi:lysophospholipase L1-like esterase
MTRARSVLAMVIVLAISLVIVTILAVKRPNHRWQAASPPPPDTLTGISRLTISRTGERSFDVTDPSEIASFAIFASRGAYERMDKSGYGYLIRVDHSNGESTYYNHFGVLGPKPGGFIQIVFVPTEPGFQSWFEGLLWKHRNDPTAAVARTDSKSRTAHDQLLDKATKGRIDVYFVGDSITRRWGATDYPDFLANWKRNFHGWNAANFGWGGDNIQNILWRLKNGELDKVNPKVIVVMAGANNIGAVGATGDEETKVADIAKGLKVVLGVCHEKAPEAVVILMGITPRNDNPAFMKTINKVNKQIERLAADKKVRFLNINDKLADKEGKFLEGMSPDRLHLSAKGYQVWAEALKPLFKELLGPPAKDDLAPPPTGIPSADDRTSGPAKK